jgi:hypothetical protein
MLAEHTPITQTSDGRPVPADLFDDGVPKEFEGRTDPLSEFVKDPMKYGDGPSISGIGRAKDGRKITMIVSRLQPDLVGVLYGHLKPNKRVRWIEYRRVEMSFEEARRTLVNWTCETREMDLPIKEDAA